MSTTTSVKGREGLEIRGPVSSAYADILSPDALRFVERLVREFAPRRDELLPRGAKSGSGNSTPASVPDFLPETEHDPPGRLDGGPHPARICRIAAWKSPAPRTGK